MHPPSHQDYHENPAANRHRARRINRGFTLIELLVVIAVAVIMATWAIPNYQQFTGRNQVVAEVMRIKTTLATARNTAVTRRTTIAVCPVLSPTATQCSFDDWGRDLVIVAGQAPGGDLTEATLLRVVEGGIGPAVSFNRNFPIRFQPTGWSRGHNGTFTTCRKKAEGAEIIINNMGRARTSKDAILSCQSN